jgi:hypothetical protein
MGNKIDTDAFERNYIKETLKGGEFDLEVDNIYFQRPKGKELVVTREIIDEVMLNARPSDMLRISIINLKSEISKTLLKAEKPVTIHSIDLYVHHISDMSSFRISIVINKEDDTNESKISRTK